MAVVGLAVRDLLVCLIVLPAALGDLAATQMAKIIQKAWPDPTNGMCRKRRMKACFCDSCLNGFFTNLSEVFELLKGKKSNYCCF